MSIRPSETRTVDHLNTDKIYWQLCRHFSKPCSLIDVRVTL
jgi:hypothetical protein